MEIKWDFAELTSSAATGDPTKATAEKGEKMAKALVKCMVDTIKQLDGMGWDYRTTAIR